jgi:hypothetical protein
MWQPRKRLESQSGRCPLRSSLQELAALGLSCAGGDLVVAGEDPITLGEVNRNFTDFKIDVNRNLREFKVDVNGRFDKLSTEIRNQSFVRKDVFESDKVHMMDEIAGLKAELAEVKEDRKWFSRLVIGIVMGIIINSVFLVVLARGGV